MTPVTKAYLPNKDKYKAYVDRIYDTANQSLAVIQPNTNNTSLKIKNHQAWRNGWLSNEQVAKTAQALSKNGYGKYLADLIEHKLWV